MGLDLLKRRRESAGPGCAIPTRPFQEFRALLPFYPTQAQRWVMDEVALDMASSMRLANLFRRRVDAEEKVN